MIKRIVRLVFDLEYCEPFMATFEGRKHSIISQKGCSSVELLQGKPGEFFTISIWDSELSLNTYRESELFGAIWPSIKPHFVEKPMAWTTTVVSEAK